MIIVVTWSDWLKDPSVACAPNTAAAIAYGEGLSHTDPGRTVSACVAPSSVNRHTK